MRWLVIVVVAVMGLSAGTVAASASDHGHHFGRWMWSAKFRALLREEPLVLPADWRRRLVVRPPPGPEIQREELLVLLGHMAVRDYGRVAIIAEQHDLIARFGEALGLKFEIGTASYRVLHDVAFDSLVAVMYFKHQFSRARPWQHLPGLAPIVEKPGHPAYPSGHAVQATTLALTLSRLLPGCRNRLMTVAARIGRNREIAGVHFRSDTVAGERLGRDVVQLIFGRAGFERRVAKAKGDMAQRRPSIERRCRS